MDKLPCNYFLCMWHHPAFPHWVSTHLQGLCDHYLSCEDFSASLWAPSYEVNGLSLMGQLFSPQHGASVWVHLCYISQEQPKFKREREFPHMVNSTKRKQSYQKITWGRKGIIPVIVIPLAKRRKESNKQKCQHIPKLLEYSPLYLIISGLSQHSYIKL